MTSNKIAIIGSSYSNGGHKITNSRLDTKTQYCKPKTEWYKKYSDYEYINLAFPGRGSEQFLYSIIYAHSQGCDTVIMEMTKDRSRSIVRNPSENYLYDKKIAEPNNPLAVFDEIMFEPGVYRHFVKSTSAYRDPSPTDKQWPIKIDGVDHELLINKVKFQVLEDAESWLFFTFEKLYWAIKCIHQLGMKVLLWEMISLGQSHMKTQLVNLADGFVDDFDEGASTYFYNKYNDLAFCDGDHFVDDVYEELVRDHLIPHLNKMINSNG